MSGEVGATSASERRKELGTRLRNLRKARGLTSGEVAGRSGISRSQVSRMENGWIVPTAELMDQLADAMALDANERRDILQRFARVTDTGEFPSDGRYFSQSVLRSLESGASLIQVQTAGWIPALLQTEQYASETLDAFAVMFQTASYRPERELLFRMQRQAELFDHDKCFEFVISHHALQDGLSLRVDMAQQIDKLIDAAQRPNVVIRIASARMNASVDAANYTILDDQVLLYDTSTGWYKTRDEFDVQSHRLHWKVSVEQAMDESESLAAMRSIRESWVRTAADSGGYGTLTP